MRYGMAIDTKRCIGCNTCAVACKVENNLPRNTWWNRVLTVGGDSMDTPSGSFPNLEMSYVTLACQHCENPACTRVCPVKATFKDPETGVVMQDYSKCIGCRYCMAACPYNGVRNFNWKQPEYILDFPTGGVDVPAQVKGTVTKCMLCSHRTSAGLEPACIQACPERARYFGDLDDPNSEISRVLAERGHHQLLDEQGTNPSVFFLA